MINYTYLAKLIDIIGALWSMGFQLLFIVGIYSVPIIIAQTRNIKRKKKLTIITIALGWTFFVWAACLAWSIWGKKHGNTTCISGGEPIEGSRV